MRGHELLARERLEARHRLLAGGDKVVQRQPGEHLQAADPGALPELAMTLDQLHKVKLRLGSTSAWLATTFRRQDRFPEADLNLADQRIMHQGPSD